MKIGKTKRSKYKRGKEQKSVLGSLPNTLVSIHRSQSRIELKIRRRAETKMNCLKI